MDYSAEYKQKSVSADEAAKVVQSGDWVDFGWCTGTPAALDKALAKRTDELKDVNFRGGVLCRPLAIMEREDAGKNQRFESAVCICMVCNEDLAENCVHHRLGAPASTNNSIDS